MSLRYALLGILEAEPMTGYDLASFLDQSSAWVWSAPHSNIYPELKKMEADGLVVGRSETRGKRLQRIVYTISDEGLTELRRWTASAPAATTERDPFLLRAIFFDLIDFEDAVELLESAISEQKVLIETWAAHQAALLVKGTPLLKKRLEHRDPSSHDHVATLKAHVFQALIDVARARINWAEREIELVRAAGCTTKIRRERAGSAK